MSPEDTPAVDDEGTAGSVDDDVESEDVRDRLEREADRAVEQFDQGIVELLSWVLDTETRARIYVHLRKQPESTSEEIAEGTGLYPSTVREALAELHDEGRVTRVKRENSGAGNNPYEYSAIPPSDLVQEVVDDVQSELNTVFNLDNYLGEDDEPNGEPVTVTVTEEGRDTEVPDSEPDVDASDPSTQDPDGDASDGDDEGDAGDGDRTAS
jgi:predicted transcriptional regulator